MTDRDLDELPPEVRQALTIHLVERVDEALALSLRSNEKELADPQEFMPAMG